MSSILYKYEIGEEEVFSFKKYDGFIPKTSDNSLESAEKSQIYIDIPIKFSEYSKSNEKYKDEIGTINNEQIKKDAVEFQKFKADLIRLLKEFEQDNNKSKVSLIIGEGKEVTKQILVTVLIEKLEKHKINENFDLKSFFEVGELNNENNKKEDDEVNNIQELSKREEENRRRIEELAKEIKDNNKKINEITESGLGFGEKKNKIEPLKRKNSKLFKELIEIKESDGVLNKDISEYHKKENDSAFKVKSTIRRKIALKIFDKKSIEKINELKTKLNNNKSEIEVLTNSMNENIKELDNKQKSINELSNEIKKKQEENNDLKNQNVIYKMHIQIENSNKVDYIKKNKKLKADIGIEEKPEETCYNDRIEKLRLDKAQAENKKEILIGGINNINNEETGDVDVILKNQSNITAFQKELTPIDLLINNIDKEIDKIQKDENDKKMIIESKKEKFSNIEKKINEIDIKINDLKLGADSNSEKIQNNLKQIKSLELNKKEITNNITEIKKKNSNILNNIENITENNVKIQEKLFLVEKNKDKVGKVAFQM